jgi:hypothetical protein
MDRCNARGLGSALEHRVSGLRRCREVLELFFRLSPVDLIQRIDRRSRTWLSAVGKQAERIICPSLSGSKRTHRSVPPALYLQVTSSEFVESPRGVRSLQEPGWLNLLKARVSERHICQAPPRQARLIVALGGHTARVETRWKVFTLNDEMSWNDCH